jgi:hypothetical protein
MDLLSDKLDPEILALLAEQENYYHDLESVAEIVEKSLKIGNAKPEESHMRALDQVVSSITSRIKEEISDSKYWSVYSATGLTARSCEEIRKKVATKADLLSTLLKNADSMTIRDLVEIILESVIGLDEMHTDNEYLGSYFDLLISWLLGTGVNDIIKEFKLQVTKPEELGSLIDDLYSYRLPWITSAFLKIACFELQLEEKELSTYARFISSMVKYGVPNPAACWAMVIGIPYRKVAIGLGDKYLSEDDSPDFNKFRQWFYGSDPKSLLKGYRLTTPVIEDVIRAQEKSTRNILLTYKDNSDDEVIARSWVKGIFSSDNKKILADNTKRGNIVTLERDYGNMFDRNAVAVVLRGQNLGMVDKNVAQLIAPLMDSGVSITGVVRNVERGRTIEIEIEIYKKNKYYETKVNC